MARSPAISAAASPAPPWPTWTGPSSTRCTSIPTSALGVPVLVLRDVTDRPEAIETGTALLVGTDPRRIHSGPRRVLLHPGVRAARSRAVNPYGDGKAAGRIERASGLRTLVGVRQRPLRREKNGKLKLPRPPRNADAVCAAPFLPRPGRIEPVQDDSR